MLLSQILLHTMPSTTPGRAQGKMSTAMRMDRPVNLCCSATAIPMARTVDNVTPTRTYSAVLAMLERTASSLNSRRKLSSPENVVGGFSS